MQQQYDVAIVGAGLVGSSLACCLAATSCRVMLLDCQPPSDDLSVTQHGRRDGRSITLTLASKKMYDRLGIWQHLEAAAVPIKKIHISDQGRFGATRLDCARYAVESFGYLVPAEKLTRALRHHLRQRDNICRLQPYRVSHIESRVNAVVVHGDGALIGARLLVAADGAGSGIRDGLGIGVHRKAYGQTAIVGSIGIQNHHQYTAYERFTKSGPLAVLPRAGNCCGFIWMNPQEIAEQHIKLSDKRFLQQLQRAFGHRLGYFSRLSQRCAYPLSLLVSKRRVQRRVVLIGNAAQTLHPIAGQGLNLALREVAELSEILAADGNAIADIDAKLAAYEACRQPDIDRTVRFTDRLNSLSTADDAVLSRVRGWGLVLLGALPMLEARIVRHNLRAPGPTATRRRRPALPSARV